MRGKSSLEKSPDDQVNIRPTLDLGSKLLEQKLYTSRDDEKFYESNKTFINSGSVKRAEKLKFDLSRKRAIVHGANKSNETDKYVNRN